MGRETSLVADPGPTAVATATATAAKTGSSATALAPGFRFHPTDEELVSYYLKRKVTNKPARFDAIAEVDIYKHEPWNLSDKSKLKTRDQEWYFFSLLDKKYGNGGRMNRATGQGYWKATGKDREVRHNSQLIGMKKTLVFHSGKAPDGLRTNWVMHEYRLIEEELERIGALQGYVLCRVIHKNNIGPPNGNRYAPFIEAEWDDGSAALVPGLDTEDDVAAGNDSIATNDVAATENAATESNGVLRISSEQEDIEHPDEDAPPSADVPRESPNERTDDCTLLPPCKIERSDDCPPLCMPNREAPLSLFGHKRRRHNDFGPNHANVTENSTRNVTENSTRMTQDRWSSTTTTTTTTPPPPSSATTMAVSALLEFSLMESMEPKENLHVPPTPKYNATTILNSMVPPSCMKLINDLQKEIHNTSIERETLKLEMMSAQTMIDILQSKIDFLSKENEDLKKSNRDV
ncbi:hypothetical protein ERO13_A05G291800v2 [Gossypium hirsutum]|uniref:NAC domain containing protein 50 n=1 Tax=Gossypium hirsutum TaxID=3635 RepID=A0A1U8PDS5_GOSHI|nr:NAC domain containing protein 50 [Gossypium hirsutum]KAG4201660.1 hypothetical protein ERO13_A05G291800v2 [Gossypium hirsutum]